MNKCRKILSLLFALTFLCSLFSLSVSAAISKEDEAKIKETIAQHVIYRWNFENLYFTQTGSTSSEPVPVKL